MPEMRGRRKPKKDRGRRSTLGENHNQISKNKREGRNNTNNRRILGSSSKRYKGKRDNKNIKKPRHTIQPENN